MCIFRILRCNFSKTIKTGIGKKSKSGGTQFISSALCVFVASSAAALKADARVTKFVNGILSYTCCRLVG